MPPNPAILSTPERGVDPVEGEPAEAPAQLVAPSWSPPSGRAEDARILAAIERVHSTARAVVDELKRRARTDLL